MSTPTPTPISLTDEFSSCALGDARRTARLIAISEAISSSPTASFPQLFDGAGLEAGYRLMSNDAVEFEDVLNAHTKQSSRRCREEGVVLAVHDTTEIAFSLRDDVYRDHLSRLSSRRQGFYLHASLAVSAEGDRRPLGVIAARPYVHQEGVEHDEGTRAFWAQRDGLFDNESARWLQSVEAAEDCLRDGCEREDGSDPRVIHVADREGDSYEFFASMVELEREFVVRASHNRSIDLGEEEGGLPQTSRLFQEIDQVPFFETTRTVTLSPRSANRSASAKKTHPTRRERTTTLSFRSTSVTIQRPRDRPELDHLPSSVDVTVVEALERHPPDGEEPVRWLLFTTEVCEDVDDALRVVDWYRARWLIEEYFKAIKTGCRYEQRQFGSAHALLNMLATTLVVAVKLLELRCLSRHSPKSPATILFKPEQLTMLAALLPKKNITVDIQMGDALLAVASLGGHLKRNGSPGWLTLYRGYTKLLDAEAGWRAMQELTKM